MNFKKKKYFEYRKQIYASINARKGNLMVLSKSNLIQKNELEILNKAIDILEELRICIKSNGY